MPANALLAATVGVQEPAFRRPPGSRVRHGQASCADYGCGLSACRQASRRARRQREQERTAGLTAKVDAAPAANHAVILGRRGMSAQDIADISGISVTLIRRLLRPPPIRPARISRMTSDAILGISIASSRGRGRLSGGRGLVDAAPAAGLLSELAQAGWPATHLADRLNISTRTIAAIRDRQRLRIRIPLDQALQRLHRQLVRTTPQAAGIRPADAARTRAHHQRRCPTNAS